MESNKCATWYTSFKNAHAHIAVSMAHKVGNCISQICSGAFDYKMNKEAQKGTMPAEDSDFVQGLVDYGSFIEGFQKMISVGEIGH